MHIMNNGGTDHTAQQKEFIRKNYRTFIEKNKDERVKCRAKFTAMNGKIHAKYSDVLPSLDLDIGAEKITPISVGMRLM